MSTLSPESYCIPRRHRLNDQTTKQALSNFESKNLENKATFRTEA